MYYVYRFLDKDNDILYVGRTVNLKERINQHFCNGHLPKECYVNVSTIEFIELKTKTEMDIYELYYINKWNPPYNTKDNNNETLSLKLEEFLWKTYSTKEEKSYIEQLNQKIFNLTNKCRELEKLNSMLSSYNNELLERDYIYTSEKKQNINLIQISVDEVIKIYEFSKSEEIKFTSQLASNGVEIDSYILYYKDGTVYLSDSKSMETNEDIEIYNTITKRKYTVFNLGLVVKYIPNSDIAYRILAKVMEEEYTKYLDKYKFETNATKILKDRLEGNFVDIINGHEICVTFIDNELYNLSEGSKCIVNRKDFINKYKNSLFKNARYEVDKKCADDVFDKIKIYENASVYNYRTKAS